MQIIVFSLKQKHFIVYNNYKTQHYFSFALSFHRGSEQSPMTLETSDDEHFF